MYNKIASRCHCQGSRRLYLVNYSKTMSHVTCAVGKHLGRKPMLIFDGMFSPSDAKRSETERRKHNIFGRHNYFYKYYIF